MGFLRWAFGDLRVGRRGVFFAAVVATVVVAPACVAASTCAGFSRCRRCRQRRRQLGGPSVFVCLGCGDESPSSDTPEAGFPAAAAVGFRFAEEARELARFGGSLAEDAHYGIWFGGALCRRLAHRGYDRGQDAFVRPGEEIDEETSVEGPTVASDF